MICITYVCSFTHNLLKTDVPVKIYFHSILLKLSFFTNIWCVYEGHYIESIYSIEKKEVLKNPSKQTL